MMNWIWQQSSRVLRLSAGIFLISFAASLPAADRLAWRKSENRVDAEITSWNLTRLLQELARVTDWQIYVEPSAERAVSTKFKSRTPGEALGLLLGDLSYALVPQSNQTSRLYVFRTTVTEAVKQIHVPSESAKPIANEIIVTLKKGANIDELARKLGAKVVGRMDALNTYRLRFDDEQAAAAARETLKQSPEVDRTDSNFNMVRDPSAEQLAMSSLAPLNLRPRAVGDSDRIVIGLIDTPFNASGSAADAFLLPGISVVGDGQPANVEGLTHGGSMVQSFFRGVAAMTENADGSRVRILPVDVYGNNPSTTTFDVARGVYEAVNQGATIINLSLGSEGDSGILQQVIKNSHAQGVLFFAAAGNQPVSTPSFPAAYPEVIAVTAGTSNGQLAPYANRGDFVDVVAPGSVVVTYQGQAYMVTGTSAASAFASGIAAGLADGTRKKLPEIDAAIRQMLAPKVKP